MTWESKVVADTGLDMGSDKFPNRREALRDRERALLHVALRVLESV